MLPSSSTTQQQQKKLNKVRMIKVQQQYEKIIHSHIWKQTLDLSYTLYENGMSRLCKVIDRQCQFCNTTHSSQQHNQQQKNSKQQKQHFQPFVITVQLLRYLQCVNREIYTPTINEYHTHTHLQKIIFYTNFANLLSIEMQNCNLTNIEFLTYLNTPNLKDVLLGHNNIVKLTSLAKASYNMARLKYINLSNNMILSLDGLSRCFPKKTQMGLLFVAHHQQSKSEHQGMNQFVKLSLRGLYCIDSSYGIKKDRTRCIQNTASFMKRCFPRLRTEF